MSQTQSLTAALQTAAGTGALATQTKPFLDSLVTLQLDGTFAGLQFKVEGSLDGTNGFTSLPVIDVSGNSATTGGTIAPADSTPRIYHVPNVQNLAGLRANISAFGSGAPNFRWSSSSQTGQPVAPISGNLASNQSQLANFRNVLDGGDFTVNPWQRGTAQAADIANVVTYMADRFFTVGGASSTINWSKVADTSIAGFSSSLKWQRKSGNANTAAFNMGQVMETIDSIRLQGQTVTLSFYAKTGANYSGGNLTVKLESSTGTDQSAANLVAGSWTTQADVINTAQALTATMTRYTFTGTVPAACTQLGLLLTWTPVGTAGADDSITLNGFQLEVGGAATVFEHRDIEVELALCQRYYFRLTEANGLNLCTGAPTGTNTQGYSFWLPTPMRAAPTLTLTAGGWKIIIDGAAPAAVSGLAAGTAHSNSVVSLVTTNTVSAAAHSLLLQGSATTGLIEASAEY